MVSIHFPFLSLIPSVKYRENLSPLFLLVNKYLFFSGKWLFDTNKLPICVILIIKAENRHGYKREREKFCVTCPQVTLFSSQAAFCPSSSALPCITALGWHTSIKVQSCVRTWIKFTAQNGIADVMGEKANHDTGAQSFTFGLPTPFVLEGSSRNSSKKENVPVSSDMWHQKALTLVSVTHSYILMLLLKLSEPTCGGSVSNNFHMSDCTDQSWALDVCHRCVTPAHPKCCSSNKWDWLFWQGGEDE